MPKFIGELLPKGNFALVDSDNIRGGSYASQYHRGKELYT